ncbi:transposase [Chryseobacterium sp. Ch-15]|uniref:Transposase n=1 Tax=Chryseobacterium muglaense TaxID=2893752 RepID=A0A9Q3UYR4_9FLAO|nr:MULTISPECIES: transposase [Chryseobacterium]MBD3905841.1 transposase [Chryseobacterium muglaense]MBO6184307.1 transposase [Chryseobacterium sp.]MCC9035774.1 transposase [Chryseobacterium muglaense]MCM2555484.1 transposase [Chryseobacterium muglaense]
MTDIRTTPIEADRFYHIYNRGINGENIFKSDYNYLFFLNKISEFLVPVCDVYAYCLMSNHFHLLIKVKSDIVLESLVKVQNLDKASERIGLHSPQNIFSKQFARIFNSYSQAFNKENNRHGALIESPFKRKAITSDEYLINTIIYIHQNPQNHSVVGDFSRYNFSSYQSILSNSKTLLKRNEVIELFDDKENFILSHKKIIDFKF